MDGQRIRPSLADLADLDLNAPAFPELDENAGPAVTVSRTRPPTIQSAPPPIPVIESTPSGSTLSSPPPPPPSKPKSRFALQREKEAAERAGSERFELDLDGNDGGALPKANPRPSLIKDVLERPSSRISPPKPPSAPSPPQPSTLSKAIGFPPVGKGVFPRRFAPQPSLPGPAFVEPSKTAPSASPFEADAYVDNGSVTGLLDLVSKENEDVLRGMSEREILEEQRQVREELGLSGGIIEMLQRRADKRAQGIPSRTTPQPIPTLTPRSRPPPASAPPPPRPRPTETTNDDDLEEGTPEYIRRHFFPNEPVNPALDWMKPLPPGPGAGSPSQASEVAILAFDLQGTLVADSLPYGALPNLAGEHHVSSSSTFTIPSLLALSASSVPSQRSTAFSTLHKIVTRSQVNAERIGEKEWTTLRQQLVQKAGWALRDSNRGVVSAAIDLLEHLCSTEVTSPTPVTSNRLANAEEPKTFLSSFQSSDPFVPLASHLSVGSLPRSSLHQILSILVAFIHLARNVGSSASYLDALLSTPKLVESVVTRFIATPWPTSSSSTTSDDASDLPSPLALSFLSLLASSSRSRAKELVKRDLIDSTLRYLAIPPWDLEQPSPVTPLGYRMLEGSFELWRVLARYGIGCEMRTKAAALLEGIFVKVSEVCSNRNEEGNEETKWIDSLLDLLSMWTTAAVDPHVCEHDIVWSQVEGWKDLAVEVYEWAIEDEGRRKTSLTKSWRLLAAWLEGSKVNRSWRGEDERRWIRERFEESFKVGGKAEEVVVSALRRLANDEGNDDDAEVVVGALLLSEAHEERSNPSTDKLLKLEGSLVEGVIDSLVSRPSSSSIIDLLVHLVSYVKASNRFSSIVNILPFLRADHAVAARDLVDRLLSIISKPDFPLRTRLDPNLEAPVISDVALLRPFFTHAIVAASGGRVVGPSFPTPRDIKLTACLPPFSSTDNIVKPDWPLVALDELLRSATSPVFEKLPSGWDATELQLVKASLVLMRLVTESKPVHKVDPSTLVYDVIKVFMLEKDNGGTSSIPKDAIAETDLFRNEAVQHSLNSLLSPLSIAQLPTPQIVCPDVRSSSSTIEGVSSLVSTAPFYQLYTDLVGLYDSISLSNRLFGLVLLPPLAMSYPVDFRRLLWTDYSHVLRTITCDIDEAISDVSNEGPGGGGGGETALSRYLYPVDSDETMLKAYVDALSNRKVLQFEQSPFLTFIAIHHVSQTLFTTSADKHDDEDRSVIVVEDKVKIRLVKTLLHQADREVLEKVVSYRQGLIGETVKVSPECFEIEDELKKTRIGRLVELGGGGGGEVRKRFEEEKLL